ncbi:MAG TPA: DNA polymerase ligase N-terminal domain-containing protein [Gemmatimonadales bacterium]|jgi:bifunctional non-homologous end joining protein LigD|nr:DNA polymerase ligase N-terminal domain-containing protein [Gemmatimonadales bacterium]
MPAKKPTSAKAGPSPSLAEYERKRDFTKTAEPRGKKTKSTKQLVFVVQKHAATRLHFDLRLELDGVMKSWAVPKGPSLDPAEKRLAMEVEDHPIEYNAFEGIIPKGQYGGGTVMIWDRGIYTYGNDDMDPVEGLRRGYHGGDLKFVMLGERLKGSFVLVRMKGKKVSGREWLLIKHQDDFAKPGSDVVKEYDTSVVSNRTMDKIAKEATAVWNSNAK